MKFKIIKVLKKYILIVSIFIMDKSLGLYIVGIEMYVFGVWVECKVVNINIFSEIEDYIIFLVNVNVIYEGYKLCNNW